MSGGASKGAAQVRQPGTSAMASPGKHSLNKHALFRLMTVERATRQTTAMVETTKRDIEFKMQTASLETREIVSTGMELH